MGQVRKTRRRGVRTDPDIASAARRLALTPGDAGEQWTAAGIHRRLLEGHPEWGPRMPTVRTIQNLVRGLVSAAPNEPWSFSADRPEDGRLVLDLLGELWDAGVWPKSVTVEEARYIVRLRRAFQDLPAVRTLALARAYIAATDTTNIYTLPGLDRYLAFAPWRDDAARYIQALVEGRIYEYFGMPGDPSDQDVLQRMRAAREAPRKAQREAAIQAGANPFFDGRPFRQEDKP
jgi:hypothetical protein